MPQSIADVCTETEHPRAGVSNPSPSPASAFIGDIEPTLLTAKYKAGLALVAVAMVLLLAVYCGLILLVSYGVYYHLVHHATIMKTSGANLVALALYLAPACAGPILVFFMVKPFLAGRPPEPDRYTLTPQSDPVLFAFIARICELVQAPLPSRVDVDCAVNASASFRRGWRSLAEDDVVLTIGLPLVAGLNMQEFAGVLAHELGHFAQGAGMRLTYVIRSTSHWFARVVYERDEWDVKLDRAAHAVDLRLGIFLHFTRLSIWLSRRILWALMHLGRMFSAFMLRQMEFDADSYETKVAGSAAFARTSTKLATLTAASQWAHSKMHESWEHRRLPENLPGFIERSSQTLPPELRKAVEETTTQSKARLFDSHPCDADRVRAATAMNASGVFHLTQPASHLFNQFDELSKGATRFHYESAFELRITQQNLVSDDLVTRETRMQAEGETALGQFFFGLKLSHRPLLLPEPVSPPATTEELAQNIAKARQAMEESKAPVQKALREYVEAESLYQRGLNALSRASQKATEMAEATQRGLIPTLATFENHAQQRLASALQMLHRPEYAATIHDVAALQSEAEVLCKVFDVLGRAFTPLQEVRRKTDAFATACDALDEPNRGPVARARIEELAPDLESLLAGIRPLLEGVPFPFRHAREALTLHEFARTEFAATQKLQTLYNNCTCHVERLLPLYHRVLGRLAFIALQVEECLFSDL